jgi:hypothetical protein
LYTVHPSYDACQANWTIDEAAKAAQLGKPFLGKQRNSHVTPYRVLSH